MNCEGWKKSTRLLGLEAGGRYDLNANPIPRVSLCARSQGGLARVRLLQDPPKPCHDDRLIINGQWQASLAGRATLDSYASRILRCCRRWLQPRAPRAPGGGFFRAITWLSLAFRRPEDL